MKSKEVRNKLESALMGHKSKWVFVDHFLLMSISKTWPYTYLLIIFCCLSPKLGHTPICWSFSASAVYLQNLAIHLFVDHFLLLLSISKTWPYTYLLIIFCFCCLSPKLGHTPICWSFSASAVYLQNLTIHLFVDHFLLLLSISKTWPYTYLLIIFCFCCLSPKLGHTPICWSFSASAVYLQNLAIHLFVDHFLLLLSPKLGHTPICWSFSASAVYLQNLTIHLFVDHFLLLLSISKTWPYTYLLIIFCFCYLQNLAIHLFCWSFSASAISKTWPYIDLLIIFCYLQNLAIHLFVDHFLLSVSKTWPYTYTFCNVSSFMYNNLETLFLKFFPMARTDLCAMHCSVVHAKHGSVCWVPTISHCRALTFVFLCFGKSFSFWQLVSHSNHKDGCVGWGNFRFTEVCDCRWQSCGVLGVRERWARSRKENMLLLCPMSTTEEEEIKQFVFRASVQQKGISN